MRRGKADSCELIANSLKTRLGMISLHGTRSLWSNGVLAVRTLWVLLVQVGVFMHQVVFATAGMFINSLVVRSLYVGATQVFTRSFLGFNSSQMEFIHIIPSPNNNYYKEN